MEKANPVQTRQSLRLASDLAKHGVPFVPVVFASEATRQKLIKIMEEELEKMESEALTQEESVNG
ncbi:DUF1382 family protein [Endozoicomonas sp. GU-1]|uniref:DUF1382 family protein n=1 Tax=Endozoicomonas sp. GU-1 TaxID=3009078 RepID=UPI0022B32D95|nr:DUF1382 family protein [Endozoicomonas sp. GU-1]WBA86506.1 DUF1382 family protein [Endozoicomonas sp. GU-1]